MPRPWRAAARSATSSGSTPTCAARHSTAGAAWLDRRHGGAAGSAMRQWAARRWRAKLAGRCAEARRLARQQQQRRSPAAPPLSTRSQKLETRRMDLAAVATSGAHSCAAATMSASKKSERPRPGFTEKGRRTGGQVWAGWWRLRLGWGRVRGEQRAAAAARKGAAAAAPGPGLPGGSGSGGGQAAAA